MISEGYKSAYQQGYSDAMRDFRKEPKTGHWIHRKMNNECWEECSECHVEYAYPTLYCPDCGCRMVEPQERSE